MNGGIAYVQRSFDAVVRLALRDTQALSRLDLTADGFFRSFAALVVGAPIYIGCMAGWLHLQFMVLAKNPNYQPEDFDWTAKDLATHVLLYLVLWTAFPVVIFLALRFLRLTAGFSALIIAYNWSSLLVMSLFAIPFALLGVGLIDPYSALAFLFTSFGFVLYYRFYVAMVALQSDATVAMAVSILNALLFFFLVLGRDYLTASLGP